MPGFNYRREGFFKKIEATAGLALHCVRQLTTSGNWNADTLKDTLGNKCWSWEVSGRTASCGWCPRSKSSSSGNIRGNPQRSPGDDYWWFWPTGWILQGLQILQNRGAVLSLPAVSFCNTSLQRYLRHWWFQLKISNPSWTGSQCRGFSRWDWQGKMGKKTYDLYESALQGSFWIRKK